MFTAKGEAGISQHGRRVQRLHADNDELFFLFVFALLVLSRHSFTDDIDGLTDTWKWGERGGGKDKIRTHAHTDTH